jgi:hypothetical protein
MLHAQCCVQRLQPADDICLHVVLLQGHQQPQLWMTIVAPHAFALPTYRLDL